MSAWFDCADEAQRAAGLAAAVTAILAGELVVLPTDTVYGVGADAFNPAAVRRLLAAKGRGPEMPPPVLVGSVRAANALVEDMGQDGQKLISEFWPGALTIVCRATRSLSWDLGETKGTVAVRMPEDAVALDLLRETGPMAVSSANLTGAAAATTAEQAREQLGESVSIYRDGARRRRLDDHRSDRPCPAPAAPGGHLRRAPARGGRRPLRSGCGPVMSQRAYGCGLACPPVGGMSGDEAGRCPRVAVMAFDPGPTR